MFNCYYCRDFKDLKVPLPNKQMFCNEIEEKQWQDKVYGKRGGHKSIGEIQARLLKMGKQAPVTTNGQLFEETDDTKVSLDH